MPPKSKTPRKKDKEADKQSSVEEFQNVDISTKDPRTVVLMLDSPEPVIICKTCEALKKYVEISESNCIEVMELGSLPRLVKLLSSTEKVIRSFAVLCVASMVANGAVRRALYNLDIVGPLLTMLVPEEELVTQERASFSLSLMAVEYSYKVQLEKHSAHVPLLKLLQSPDADVQRNCVKTLCLMVEHYQSRPGVLEADGLPLIMELLKSEYSVIQELALQTLHSCMQNVECRKAVVNGDGLAKIVSFLGNKDCSELHVLAVLVLSLCLEDAESMVALQSSDCLQQLLQHITDSNSSDMKCHAAKALAKAATNSINQRILHEQQTEKTFLDLLSSEESGVIESGCNGLRVMCSLQSSRQFIGSEGGLAALVECAQSEVGSVRSAAAHTIAALINGAPANCKLLAEAGGIDVVVKLLSDSMAESRQFAADSITSMSPDESLRSQFESGGAVENLVNCLSFADSAVQASSVEALGMLCCNASARHQLSSSVSGVASLIELLRSTHQDVVYKATWALSVCARSSAVAEAICKIGGLKLVENLSKSSTGHAQSAAAGAALTRLLDSNLSAKYWVSGRLEPTDLIQEMEFFDAGLAQSSSRSFIPLSELVQRSLSGNQPVITVNLLPKPPLPTPTSLVTDDQGGAPTQNGLDGTQSTANVSSRSKSRQQGLKEGKRRSRPEKEIELLEAIPQDTNVDRIMSKASLPGLLEIDTGLWSHISHTQSSILPLASPAQQVEQIAKYVSEQLGGAVERSGPLGYELPASHIQFEQKTNLVPLGELKVGVFQQRALLFKLLCDQVGVACSLERGEYGRHWNRVWLAPPTTDHESTSPVASVYVVDLMFEPGTLLPANSPSADLYQHL